VDSIGGLYHNNVSITAVGSSYGGTDKETIEQVRFRAPHFYTTQNRAVNYSDYEVLLTKDYNNIDSVSVWGGEDNDPIIYGKVFISLKTKGNYVLTNLEKETIKTALIKNRNVLTITPEIIDPDYTYILVKGTVNYNSTLTGLSASEIQNYVKASIQDYTERELNKFGSVFRKSKLQYYIDNCEKSVTGSDIKIYLQKRQQLILGQQKSYTINFNTPVQKGDFLNRLSSYPDVQIYDVNGTSRQIFFEETFEIGSGIGSITMLDGGVNYFSSGTATIVGDGSGATLTPVIRNGVITSIQVTTPGKNYTKADVVIAGDGTGARASAILQTRFASIRSYYFTTGGDKIIVDENAGTINYDTGQVILNSFYTNSGTPSNQYYETDILAMNVPSQKEIISPMRNQILTIDDQDPLAIQIDVVAES
jgi:hypothetical protein